MRQKNRELFPKIEAFIGEYVGANGTAPSNAEIGEAVGVSAATAHRYICEMRDRGLLSYSGRRRISTGSSGEQGAAVSVPVLGSIACGIPKFAEENIEEYLRLPTALLGGGSFFILRADGESMIYAGISHGDMVLVRRQETAEPGQIIVALVDDDTATLKRYCPQLDRGRVILRPENVLFEDQVIDLTEHSFAIQGVAVKVIKDIA